MNFFQKKAERREGGGQREGGGSEVKEKGGGASRVTGKAVIGAWKGKTPVPEAGGGAELRDQVAAMISSVDTFVAV